MKNHAFYTSLVHCKNNENLKKQVILELIQDVKLFSCAM